MTPARLAVLAAGLVCVLAVVLGSAYIRYAYTGNRPAPSTGPVLLIPGQKLTLTHVAALLRRLDFGDGRPGRSGSFLLRPGSVDIFPREKDGQAPEPARIECDKFKIVRIVSLRTSRNLPRYELKLR